MTWEILNLLGTIAFAISGAIVAMQARYDMLGIYVLAFVTAFGGGAIRNVLIGLPVSVLWDQQLLFIMTFVVVTLFFLFPAGLIERWNRWGHFFDAMGLAAFSIQGALFAYDMGLPLSAVIVAATLTGTGGGMIRDVLAGRRPLVFRDEIYAIWAILVGLIVGLGWMTQEWLFYVLFIVIVLMRMLSVIYNWKLPKRSYEIPKETD